MKISIIGSGRLGSTTAFELINRELASEIVLVDIIPNLPQGEAMDLNQMSAEKGKNTIVYGSNDYNHRRCCEEAWNDKNGFIENECTYS